MALVNPNIAMSFRMPEFQSRNALAEYAQIQQIQGGQRQAEVADMQLAQMRQKEKAIRSIQAKAAQGGGPTDRRAIARAYIDSGDFEFMKFGLAMETTIDQLDAFAAYQSEFGPKAQNALGASPTGMDLSAGAQAPGDYTSTQTMGRVPGVVTTPIPESPPMNAMAPAPAAPANAMAGKPDVASLEARYRRVSDLDTRGARAETALLLKQIEAAYKESPLYTVPNVGLVDRTGQVIKPSVATPVAPTQLAKLQTERAALPPGDPRIAQYDALIRKEITPVAGTTINMVSEKAEQSARGKRLDADYKAISDTAHVGRKTLPALEANLSILDKGFDTGFGTATQAVAARVLGALGVQNAKDFATNADVFLANASSAVLQKQLEQKGPQTESDAQRITQTGAQLGVTKKGNKFLLTVAKEQIHRDIEQAEFYRKWYVKNKTYDGAEDAWFSGEGGKSLFERPALRSYLAPAASAAAQIPTAATPAVAPPAAAPAPVAAGGGTLAEQAAAELKRRQSKGK